MDIKIGDVSGCLEIIGDCVETENDLQEIIHQWAENEWFKFDKGYSFKNVDFKKRYKLSKEETEIYDVKGPMPKSFLDKYRKNCDECEMLCNMYIDERFLWHKEKPNTRYLLVKGCMEKKLYKVKCNICNRIFFMDSESFKCGKWNSCVGARCLANTMNNEDVDYSKSLYCWNKGEDELVELDTQLVQVDELSTPLTYYSAGTPNGILKIAYISDIHLEKHLEYYNDNIKQMVRDIGNKLYQSKGSADIIIFNGDISSKADLAIMFFKQFIRLYEYEEFRSFKEQISRLKKIKQKDFDNVAKYWKCCENVSKEIKNRKDDLKGKFDLIIFENYKKRYHSDISYEATYEYFKKTKSFKQYEISEYIEEQILDILRLLDVQTSYGDKIEVFEKQRIDKQYRIESFEARYSKTIEEISLNDYRRVKVENAISKNIYLILGNHEYIDFQNVQTCVEFYKDTLSKIGVTVLHNEYVETDRYLLYGGSGFAKYDEVWNANRIVCCENFTRKDEIEETTEFENGYSTALKYAKEKGLCFLCASHYPVSSCLGVYDKETIYFTGHNHRNEYVKTGKQVLYADNQVGYKNNNIYFKIATTGFEINPYSELSDGLYRTTVEDYLKFYRYIGEHIGEGKLLYKRCQGGKLYVVKRKGYYGFFIVSSKKDSKGISIVNGGTTKKLTQSTNIEWICENFDIVVERYLQMLLPLRNVQEKLSKELKELGLDGTIHGLIVDIDFYHHIAINPVEGSMEFYYSSIWGKVIKLSSFGEVIKSIEHQENGFSGTDCKLLQEKYNEKSKREGYQLSILSDNYLLNSENYELEGVSSRMEQLVSRTEGMYSVSRKISPLQRLFSGRVLRDFDLRLAQTEQQSYRKFLYTNRVFMYEGIEYQVIKDDGSDMIIAEEIQKGLSAKCTSIKRTGNIRKFAITELKTKIKKQSEYNTYWIS